jgi:hypothetical protein
LFSTLEGEILQLQGDHMGRSDYFRRNAETCLASARQATDAVDRASWFARAERWLQLTREAEAKPADEPLNPRPAPAPVAPPRQADSADRRNYDGRSDETAAPAGVAFP